MPLITDKQGDKRIGKYDRNTDEMTLIFPRSDRRIQNYSQYFDTKWAPNKKDDNFLSPGF